MVLARIVTLAVILIAMACAAPAHSSSIYDAQIEKRLPLKPEQRVSVRKIVAESRRQFVAAFKKHGIDPNAPPSFTSLFSASSDLIAISRRERQQMSQILTREQLELYDRLMGETRARVSEAAQRSRSQDANRSSSRRGLRRAVAGR
jgi:hypothetical protein